MEIMSMNLLLIGLLLVDLWLTDLLLIDLLMLDLLIVLVEDTLYFIVRVVDQSLNMCASQSFRVSIWVQIYQLAPSVRLNSSATSSVTCCPFI